MQILPCDIEPALVGLEADSGFVIKQDSPVILHGQAGAAHKAYQHIPGHHVHGKLQLLRRSHTHSVKQDSPPGSSACTRTPASVLPSGQTPGPQAPDTLFPTILRKNPQPYDWGLI